MVKQTIGQFAASCGGGVETIRYYQRRGLLCLPESSMMLVSSNIRRYGDTDVERLRFILAAEKAGVISCKIKGLLNLEQQNNRQRVRDLAEHLVNELNAKIAELTTARKSRKRLVSECK